MRVNLPEFLHERMDILFVPLNPPEVSNRNRHYFLRNRSFWNLLYDAGLIVEPVADILAADDLVFGSQGINYHNAVFGITDLNRTVVETKSSKVKADGTHVKRILSILGNHPTKVLCLIHSKVGNAFEDAGLIQRRDYGLVGYSGSTKIYEMPFHNASIPNKHLLYRKLLDEL